MVKSESISEIVSTEEFYKRKCSKSFEGLIDVAMVNPEVVMSYINECSKHDPPYQESYSAMFLIGLIQGALYSLKVRDKNHIFKHIKRVWVEYMDKRPKDFIGKNRLFGRSPK